MASFHLTLVGPPELRGPNNQIIHFRTRKHFALLIYLALEAQDHRVPRERLMALLWADVDPNRAKHSLAQGLTTIRNVLGGDAIGRGGAYVKLDTNLQTDLDTLDYVADAKTQLPEPLETLDDVGSVDFSHWIDLQRTKISKALRRALTDEVERHRAAGQSGLVRERAVQLYTIDPLNQTAVLALAEADIESGQTARTIPLLEDFLEHARVDGGAGGGGGGGGVYPRVERLLTRLKSEPLRPELPKRAPSPLPPKRAFIGRHQEIARLEDVWSQVHAPHLETCLLTGRTGIGKTSVAERFTTGIAAGGHVVLSTTCQGGGRDIPYAGLSDLIRCLEQEPELGATDPHWLAQASRIAPWLRVRFPGIPEPDLTTGETARLTIAESLAQMIETVADQCGVLILVDDIHQLDPATREVIYILTRRLHAFPLLVLGVRRTHLDADLEIERPTDDPLHWTSTIEIDRLSDSDARALAIDLTRDRADAQDRSEVIDAVQRLANGHPYFIRLLVEDWLTHHRQSLASMSAHGESDEPWRPPPAIRAAFERHYGHQTPQSRAVGEILAVAGRGLTISEIAQLTKLEVETVHHVVTEALHADLFFADGERIYFKNELHHAFAYACCSEQSRRFLHALVARSSQVAGINNIDIAYHLSRSGNTLEAARYARKGADEAVAAGALCEAERVIKSILRSSNGNAVSDTLRLCEILGAQGKYLESLDWLRNCNKDTMLPHEQMRWWCIQQENLVRGRIGDVLDSQTVAKLCLREHSNQPTGELAARLLQVAAESAADVGNLTDVSLIGTLANKELGVVDDRRSKAALRMTRGFCSMTTGALTLAYNDFVAGAEQFGKEGDHERLIRTLNGAGACAHAVGAFNVAMRVLEEARVVAESIGNRMAIANIMNSLAVTHLAIGNLETAQNLLEVACSELTKAPSNRYSATILCNRCDVLITQGRFAEAKTCLDQAYDAAVQAQLPRGIAATHWYRADLMLALRQPVEARIALQRGEEISRLEESDPKSYIPFVDPPHLPRLREWARWWDSASNAELTSPFMQSQLENLSTVVEMVGLNEWLSAEHGAQHRELFTFDQLIRATGLRGIALKMTRLGYRS